tara:strand:+ start:1423 stop:2793 length:1371 start_codon:yes stop_codon:yes gene_type:complete
MNLFKLLMGLFLWVGLIAISKAEASKNWFQWRGPLMNGSLPQAAPPIRWSETSDNLKWKTRLPGSGHSSPIIYDDRIFVLSAKEVGEILSDDVDKPSKKDLNLLRRFAVGSKLVTRKIQYIVMALSRTTGKIIWQQVANEKIPPELIHNTASWCSASPITNGKYLLALFGSAGLYCYDLEGNLQWEKDFGNMDIFWDFGEGASPSLHRDSVILNWDHQGQSFLTSLDISTGKENWRTEKDEVTSWSTPIVVTVDSKLQIVTSGDKRTRGFDFETGHLIWEVSGLTSNIIPTPIYYDNTIIVASGYRGQVIQSIRITDAIGDISNTKAILWKNKGNAPYTPSLLLYDDFLYGLKGNKAILSCFNPETGKLYFGPERLPDIKTVYASPVGAGGHIYITGRNGNFVVLKHDKQFKIIAKNKLDDKFDASPAIDDGHLYFRGHNYLYCIGKVDNNKHIKP